jgi:NAD(P)-dependent dehydrogenase (short-subunit alcohol dehydrogenase family)
MTVDLHGKTIVITGATNGIGLESAVQLAAVGASLVLVGRDPAKTEAKVLEVKQRAKSEAVSGLLVDFASRASVRRLAQQILADVPKLDILVNNAGTVFPKRVVTEDGIESTLAINHLGPYLLTRMLVDRLVASAPARVVNVASIAHRHATLDFEDLGYAKGYRLMRAYSRSKLGNLLFTRELARRLEGKGVAVHALHPGTVATGIWAHGQPDSAAARFLAPVLAFLAKHLMLTPAQGGATITHVASSPELEGKTGLYFEKNQAIAPSALAQDDELAKRMWNESARLVNLPP